MKTISFAISLLMLVLVSPSHAQILTPVNAGLINAGGDNAWFDYDNDGDLDIIQTGTTNDAPPYNCVAIVYRNNGNGTFTNINAGLTPVAGAVAVADFDNDGNVDIIEAGYSNSSFTTFATKIYRNQGNGTFTEVPTNLPDVSDCSLSPGDYDNDGDIDLLLSGRLQTNSLLTRIYRNDSGTLVDINAGLPGIYAGVANWADIDKDGDLDFVVAGKLENGTNITKIFRNDNGSFTDINAGLTGVSHCAATWGDYDSDGYPDLIVIGNESGWTNISRIYHNNGNGTFSNINSNIAQGVSVPSAEWGDIDNDGDLDLAYTGGYVWGSGFTKVYRNDGGGTFTDLNLNLTPVYYSGVKWGDYDNDGRLDLLVTGYWSSGSPTVTANLYHNNTTNANTLPTAPTNLTAVLSGNTVTLSWNKSTDNQTSQDGLTYNIRVGTSPSGIQVASPMAFVSTGLRKAAKFGKSSSNNTWQITGLNPGTYYWSVQAIDNALAGSPFAGEVTFSTNQSPVARCQNIIVSAGIACNSNASIDNGSYDPDGDPITITQYPAGPYPFGTTSVTLTVTDDKNASSSCYANVTVIDDTPPSITCPSNIITNSDPAMCSAIVTFTTTVTDNCSSPTVNCAPPSGSAFDKGTTTVLCTAIDASTNSASCSFTVTVVDVEAPTIQCPSTTTVNPTNLAGAIISYPSPTVADNCPGTTLSQIAGLSSGSTFPIGTTTNSFQVIDASGNLAICDFTVTVRDPYCADNKVNVCHNGQTICISVNALQAHLNHGDNLGDCGWYKRNVIAELPTINHLEQNFPNPFNPSTVINYTIAEECHVRLTILDLFGRTVTTLVDEEKSAGSFSSEWNGSDAKSGTYLYRLEAGAFTQVRRMTLMK